MMTKRNDKRTILRIGAAAAVLLFMAALFVGAAGAATTDGEWSTDGISQAISSGNLLNQYKTLTISNDITLDFTGSTYSTYDYYAANEGSVSGCGGLADRLDLKGKTLTIKNLHISSKKAITSSNYGTGGLFGRIQSAGKLVLDNCTISGPAIGSASGSNNVGGLVGLANSADLTIEMKNCTIDGCTIASGSNNVGGLVGLASYVSYCYTDCVVANCNITSSGSNNVGGLVGYANVGSSHVAENCVVENCHIASSSSTSVGGLVGYAESTSLKVDLRGCRVADCVIYASKGYCGGIIGYDACTGEKQTFTGNTVRNCLIYSNDGSATGAVGGVIGEVTNSNSRTCSLNTVEYCTIAEVGSKGAGGIAGKFPSEGILSGNNVFNTCVVSANGKAAGICPAVA